MNKDVRFNLWYWLAALAGILFIQYLYSANQQVAPILYSEFEQYLREGRVAEVAISDNFIRGEFKQPLEGGERYFTTTRVDPVFANELQQYDVRFTGRIDRQSLPNVNGAEAPEPQPLADVG